MYLPSGVEIMVRNMVIWYKVRGMIFHVCRFIASVCFKGRDFFKDAEIVHHYEEVQIEYCSWSIPVRHKEISDHPTELAYESNLTWMAKWMAKCISTAFPSSIGYPLYRSSHAYVGASMKYQD